MASSAVGDGKRPLLGSSVPDSGRGRVLRPGLCERGRAVAALACGDGFQPTGCQLLCHFPMRSSRLVFATPQAFHPTRCSTNGEAKEKAGPPIADRLVCGGTKSGRRASAAGGGTSVRPNGCLLATGTGDEQEYAGGRYPPRARSAKCVWASVWASS